MRVTAARGVHALVVVTGLAMVAYHMTYVQVLLVSSFEHRVIHLGFALLLVFLTWVSDAHTRWSVTIGTLLTALTIPALGYIWARSEHIENLYGFVGPVEVLVAAAVIVIVLVGTWRDWGASLPILAVVSLGYLFWGHLLPQTSYFHHGYIPLTQALAFTALESGGAMGGLLLASADYMFLFVIFGALIGVIGADRFFQEVYKLLARRLVGAGGLSTVVSSGLVAMVTGIPVSNALITGVFTIPTMKSQGYTPEQAGAIEAVAATGGQITPPVLGLAAFVMVTLAGIDYVTIAVASIIPAVLYYLMTYLSVRAVALRAGIQRTSEPVSLRVLAGSAYLFVIPMGVLIVLLAARHSVMYTAFYAIVITVALAYLRKETRLSLRDLVRHLVAGARAGASVGIATAAVGIIVQGVTTTGLGGRIASIIMSMENLFTALVMVALIALFLGLPLPTPAVYALTASLGAPVLVKMGLSELAAHMFILYYASLSVITPPVAGAVIVSAKIAGGDFWKTGLEAMRFSYTLYLVPFLWVFEPGFLLAAAPSVTSVLSVVAGALALALLVPVLQGDVARRSSLWKHGLYLATAASLFWFVVAKDFRMLLLGVVLLGAMSALQWRKKQRSNDAIELVRVRKM